MNNNIICFISVPTLKEIAQHDSVYFKDILNTLIYKITERYTEIKSHLQGKDIDPPDCIVIYYNNNNNTYNIGKWSQYTLVKNEDYNYNKSCKTIYQLCEYLTNYINKNDKNRLQEATASKPTREYEGCIIEVKTIQSEIETRQDEYRGTIIESRR